MYCFFYVIMDLEQAVIFNRFFYFQFSPKTEVSRSEYHLHKYDASTFVFSFMRPSLASFHSISNIFDISNWTGSAISRRNCSLLFFSISSSSISTFSPYSETLKRSQIGHYRQPASFHLKPKQQLFSSYHISLWPFFLHYHLNSYKNYLCSYKPW